MYKMMSCARKSNLMLNITRGHGIKNMMLSQQLM